MIFARNSLTDNTLMMLIYHILLKDYNTIYQSNNYCFLKIFLFYDLKFLKRNIF